MGAIVYYANDFGSLLNSGDRHFLILLILIILLPFCTEQEREYLYILNELHSFYYILKVKFTSVLVDLNS